MSKGTRWRHGRWEKESSRFTSKKKKTLHSLKGKMDVCTSTYNDI